MSSRKPHKKKAPKKLPPLVDEEPRTQQFNNCVKNRKHTPALTADQYLAKHGRDFIG